MASYRHNNSAVKINSTERSTTYGKGIRFTHNRNFAKTWNDTKRIGGTHWSNGGSNVQICFWRQRTKAGCAGKYRYRSPYHIKVLAPKDPKASISLPERSNTPGTAYVSYRKDGTFDQYIVFDANRMPVYEIDYGVHDHVKSLHVHFYPNGERSKKITILHPGDALYEKHKKLFKGVK